MSLDREALGRIVRATWVRRAAERPNPKPDHLLPWEQLDEWNQETDCVIGEAIANALLRGPESRKVLLVPSGWEQGWAPTLSIEPESGLVRLNDERAEQYINLFFEEALTLLDVLKAHEGEIREQVEAIKRDREQNWLPPEGRG